MINNSTKLKNSTANALSSPYAVVFFFCFFENAKYVRYSSFSRKRLILTDFDRLSSAFFFLMDSPVILEFSVTYPGTFFSRTQHELLMVVSSEKMLFFMSYDHKRYGTNCPKRTIRTYVGRFDVG